MRQAPPVFLPYAVFDFRANNVRLKVIGLYIVVIAANLLAWVWAFAASWLTSLAIYRVMGYHKIGSA